MEKQILLGVQIVVSMFEVWLCYCLLFEITLKKKLIVKQKLAIFLSTFVLGGLLGINREIGFFSILMFLFCILNTCIVAFFIQKEEKNVIAAIIILYYLVIALVDFYFEFISVSFLKEKFVSEIYCRSLSIWKCMIYILTRAILVCCMFFLRKRKNLWSAILEFRHFLWLYIVFGVSLLLQYQQILDDIALGMRQMDGIRNATSLMILIVAICLFVMVLLKNKMIEEENEFLILQDKLMVQKYQEIEQERENNRRVLHDIKNHFFVLKTYEKEKNYEGIHNYLEEIEAEFNQASGQIWTGNRIVDLILNQKKAQAEQLHIIFEIQAVPIPMWPMKESELCSFWGNLLDNAIEACCVIENGRRWISIAIEPQKSMLFIRINNSMKETPIIKKRKFISRKPQSEKHGYGLKNVERIVHRYDGEISYTAEQNTFEIRITFFEINVGDVKAT